MSIKIQYRQLWNGGTWEDWRDVGEFDVPVGTTNLSVTMPAFGQSDRMQSPPPVYGANALIGCTLHVTATRDSGTNAVSLSGGTLDTYKFYYDSETWGSHIGAAVVKGTYDYYAVDSNNAEHFVYTYDGGYTVVANYQVDISGFSIQAIHNFTVAAQQTSNEEYYGRCFNQINSNNVQVYLRFQNTYPANYRPGETYSSSTWYSHNRPGGAASIRNGNSWTEMKTLNGNGSTTGDPPYIRNASNAWVNQRKTGVE